MKRFLPAFFLRPPENGLVVAVVLLFSILVAAGLHGSSIGAWNQFVPDTVPSYSRPHVGTDRPVRSDEWAVSTPFVLAQCASPDFFPKTNPRVNGGTDMFLSTPCNPVWDWTVPGQFHNWGYFLFGAERGLAWNWWTRFLGLPLFAYLFFLGWFGNDRILAATAALAVSLGAPTQWWDTTLPFLLLYFFAGLVFIRSIAKSSGRLWLNAAGLFVSVSSFCFVGYPVFALLLLPPFIVLFAHSVECARPVEPKGRSAFAEKRTKTAIATVFLLVVFEIVYYAVVHATALDAIRRSAYPGSRFFSGGPFPFFVRHAVLDFVSALTPLASFKADLGPYDGSNPCDAAHYFVPEAALFALLVLRKRMRLRLAWPDVALIVYGAVLLAWAAFPFPRILAKASGLFLFSQRRAETMSSFVFLLSVFRLFYGIRTEKPDRQIAFIIGFFTVLLVVMGLFVPQAAGVCFLSGKGLVLLSFGLSAVAAVVFGLFAKSKRIFCAGYAALCLPGALVHPISKGLSPVYDKELAVLVREIDAKDRGPWISNDWITGNFLLAQGLECFAGTQTYTPRDFWTVIDPDGMHSSAWNRYAHRLFELSADDAPTVSALRPDVVRSTISERNIRELGIKHLVWSGKKLHEDWLKYEGRSRLRFVYTVLPDPTEPAPPEETRRQRADDADGTE